MLFATPLPACRPEGRGGNGLVSVENASVTRIGYAELQPRDDLTLAQIEAEADAFCTGLVLAPDNEKRTLWRDLARSEIQIAYPLPLELICDFHRIRLLFVAALRRALPNVVAVFEKIVRDYGTEPAIYVDDELREWVLYRTEASDHLTRFFIAAQV